MKRVSTALTAAGLFALAGCGGGTPANNAGSIDNTADFFNVTADDLGGNDMVATPDNLSGANVSAGNRTTANGSSTHSATNAAAGSSRPSHAARNSH